MINSTVIRDALSSSATMISNKLSCFIAIIIGIIILLCNGYTIKTISAKAEVSASDGIITNAHDAVPNNIQRTNSAKKINSHGQKTISNMNVTENDNSSGQKRALRESIIKLQSQKKQYGEISMMAVAQDIKQWSRGDYLQLASIFIAILSGLYFAILQVAKATKWQVKREIKQSFDILPW